MPAATQVGLANLRLGQHPPRTFDVTRLAAMRCTHERKVGFVDASVYRPTLDDVFLTLTGETKAEQTEPEGVLL